MATSPTVLAGSSSAASPDSSASLAVPVEAKFPLIPLLIAVVVGVLVAGLGVGGVAEDGAFGGVDEGVAAVEDGERRQGFETCGELIETGCTAEREAVGAAPERHTGVG